MSGFDIVGTLALVSTFVLGILQWRSSVRQNKSKEKSDDASALSINAETLMKLSKRIDELEKRDQEKEKRIDELETEVKKWKRAYTRAINHIRYKLPNEPVPDFMLDTDELMKKRQDG